MLTKLAILSAVAQSISATRPEHDRYRDQAHKKHGPDPLLIPRTPKAAHGAYQTGVSAQQSDDGQDVEYGHRLEELTGGGCTESPAEDDHQTGGPGGRHDGAGEVQCAPAGQVAQIGSGADRRRAGSGLSERLMVLTPTP